MDKNEYKARIRAYTRMVGKKSENESRDVYRETGMKVGMPLGCWVWIAGIMALLVVGFKTCFK